MSNPFCSNEDSNKICYPAQLPDFILALILPPVYVIVHEFRKGFENPMNIFKNLILTSLFYFPGFMHAMYLANNDT